MVVSPRAKKILVVEDEQALRNDIAAFLTYEGFEVLEAENGLSGINQARTYLPDLIVCDIMMPEVNGFEMLTALQKESQTAGIPFIFVTARTDKADRRRGMDQGAYDYITKPFSVEELLRSVKARLDTIDNVKHIIDDTIPDEQENITLSLPDNLRTPLTSLLSYSELLRDKADHLDRGQIADLGQCVHSTAESLSQMIENYLALAQIEIIANNPERSGPIKINPLRNPKSLIEEYAACTGRKHDREADLVLDIDEVQTVQIGESYVRKIINELVENALKCSLPETPVTITFGLEDDQAVLRVRDQGHGMPSQAISNLNTYSDFDRMLYADKDNEIGMAVVRRIVELHQGDIQIDSDPDHGTTVTIRLLAGSPR